MRYYAFGALALLSAFPAFAQQSSPLATTRENTVRPAAPAGMATYVLPFGRARIIALTDGTIPLDVHEVLRSAPKTELDALLARSHLANPVETSINAYLIVDGARIILVDTGAGVLFGPVAGKLLDSLAAAGVRPEQITDVLITHIHTDHSGGLSRNEAPLFPQARVHVAKEDYDFFIGSPLPPAIPSRFRDEALAALKPYEMAGRLLTFSGQARLFPGVTAIPAPGHTPGHTIYRFESGGRAIEFWGDLLHVGSIQFPRPDVTITFDVDQSSARSQRAAQLQRAAASRQLIAGAHLVFPGIGHVNRKPDGFSWSPIPYRHRD
jgi:glyoxylase-like metal-dependent hydrolase (beta-lactamase superfamily II)